MDKDIPVGSQQVFVRFQWLTGWLAGFMDGGMAAWGRKGRRDVRGMEGKGRG